MKLSKDFDPELFDKTKSFNYQFNLKMQLNLIETEDYPLAFRNRLFALIQYVHDEILEDKLGKINNLTDQDKILQDLFAAGTVFAGTFYNQEPDLDKVRELVFENEALIARYHDNMKMPCARWLSLGVKEVYDMGCVVQEKSLEAETIVALMSGGAEPACLLSYILETPLIIPVRYSHVSRADTKVKYHGTEAPVHLFSGRNILIAEDYSPSGESMRAMFNWVLSGSPHGIYTVTVGTKNHAPLSGCVNIGQQRLPRKDIWYYNGATSKK